MKDSCHREADNKKKIVPLPTPEFYTFYNGKEKWEKEKELRLSDAYIVKDGEPSLELKR